MRSCDAVDYSLIVEYLAGRYRKDAHHPDAFVKSKAIFERAIEKLNLTEDDKFTF